MFNYKIIPFLNRKYFLNKKRLCMSFMIHLLILTVLCWFHILIFAVFFLFTVFVPNFYFKKVFISLISTPFVLYSAYGFFMLIYKFIEEHIIYYHYFFYPNLAIGIFVSLILLKLKNK